MYFGLSEGPGSGAEWMGKELECIECPLTEDMREYLGSSSTTVNIGYLWLASCGLWLGRFYAGTEMRKSERLIEWC